VVPLLPAGEAHLEKLTEVTVENHAEKKHLTDYAIKGLSFEPQTIWLDDDLHFFGTPGKWFAILREGWESTNDQLYALDRAAEDTRNARLWREVAHHLHHPLAVDDVGLFDSEEAPIWEDQPVVT